MQVYYSGELALGPHAAYFNPDQYFRVFYLPTYKPMNQR